MSAEDYYDLFVELQEVYQYLLTGHVQPWRLKRAGGSKRLNESWKSDRDQLQIASLTPNFINFLSRN